MEELLEVLADVRADIDFETETALIDDGVLDSIDIISIVSELNDNFDIEIGAQHLIPDNFNSAEAIWNLVQKLMNE